MLWVYRLLFLPALLVLAPRYLWRMRKRGGYRANFAQRFGGHRRLPPKQPGRARVWLQAVSVGEMLAIGPLLEKLHRAGVEVYLTTTTSTGYRLAHDRYAGLVLGIAYFPVDWWPFSARAWNRISPDLAIITEGERWPEHLRQAHKRGVPALCINARMSDRSYRRLRRLPGVAGLMFNGLTRVLACSAHDEQRFRELGVPADRLVTTGNIKLDLTIPRLTAGEADQLRRELGFGASFVLLGSSTWPGEEEALVESLRAVRQAGQDCTLLLVPRHAERRGEIERLLRRTGLRYHFRSRGAAPGLMDITVADTTGELRKLTQLAELVFVGKSLPPHSEGQTPVEAAALEKPILFGPGMTNFRRISTELVERGAARRVNDGQGLVTAVVALVEHDGDRDRLAKAAAAWHRENAGAVGRTFDVISGELTRLRADR